MPRRLIKPRVGRQLNKLFALAGLRKLFTVSVPVAKTANEAATAAPEPPDEPDNGVEPASAGLSKIYQDAKGEEKKKKGTKLQQGSPLQRHLVIPPGVRV